MKITTPEQAAAAIFRIMERGDADRLISGLKRQNAAIRKNRDAIEAAEKLARMRAARGLA